MVYFIHKKTSLPLTPHQYEAMKKICLPNEKFERFFKRGINELVVALEKKKNGNFQISKFPLCSSPEDFKCIILTSSQNIHFSL